MRFDRRRFLSTLGAGVAAGALLPAEARPSGSGEPPRDDRQPLRPLRDASGRVDWEAVRGEFRLDWSWIQLGTFYLASHPRPVREAIERYRDRLDADPLWIETLFDGSPDNPLMRAKSAVARYLGGDFAEVALTPNTTTGLALLYNGLRLRADQEILTTEHDHFVHHGSIRRAVEKRGAAMRYVALYDAGERASAGEAVSRLRAAIRPRTRAVGLTWVHSSTGVKLPIAALAEAVAEANRGRAEADRCLLVVDGVHGFGVEDVEAAKLGADFFVAGTHKWLFGPRGTGVVWGSEAAWPAISQTVPSFDISDEQWRSWIERRPLGPTRAPFVAPGGFVAYEHQFAVTEAVEFHEAIGRRQIAARIHDLNRRFRVELARMPHVRLHTPQDDALAAGIVTFEVDGLGPAAVVARLAERRIHATTTPYEPTLARVAAGVMVREEEVETTLAAIRALAA